MVIISNKHLVAVGIDVAKSTLSVCIRCQDGTERALTIRNTETDISRKLLPAVHQSTGKMVMESTGHYHFLSALMLRDNGYDVRIVNPLLAKQYMSENIRKVKTDPADARGLARMAEVADNLPPTFSLQRTDLHRRKKLALLGSLQHNLQGLVYSLASLTEAQVILGTEDSEATLTLRESIRSVQKAMRTLERECVREAEEAVGRYKLIENVGVEEHVLRIEVEGPGLKAFTFTFG